ncbi:hypothetical protein [Streptomyces sp. XD-27]|uniref:hypothetical protein n=1 Tax=Streptomyces sp. XD-27 TaxID=3062779 RepID=UPI0026F45F00|nr:hypothetical protein [Streptomyces sp. XD-27]WKX72374.1 hypothetical protein Q3Y56_22910 [Streptomyces sp. XD-27]
MASSQVRTNCFRFIVRWRACSRFADALTYVRTPSSISERDAAQPSVPCSAAPTA